jgi:hypothetical protein
MNWRIFYGLKSYVRSSLWVVPFIAIPVELTITRLAHGLDGWLGWNFLRFALPGAQALLQATVTATLSFLVFTFGSLLVAIQVASSQLTPRIIATTLLRNDVVKYTVGLFIFTLIFALSAKPNGKGCASTGHSCSIPFSDPRVGFDPGKPEGIIRHLGASGIVRNFSHPAELALACIAPGLGGRSGKFNHGMQDAS